MNLFFYGNDNKEDFPSGARSGGSFEQKFGDERNIQISGDRFGFSPRHETPDEQNTADGRAKESDQQIDSNIYWIVGSITIVVVVFAVLAIIRVKNCIYKIHSLPFRFNVTLLMENYTEKTRREKRVKRKKKKITTTQITTIFTKIFMMMTLTRTKMEDFLIKSDSSKDQLIFLKTKFLIMKWIAMKMMIL